MRMGSKFPKISQNKIRTKHSLIKVKKNYKKGNTNSVISTTEAMIARYTAKDTKEMLDKIIANGGSIDHTITRDSETLSVKVNPPVVLKKVPTKVAEVKKEEVKKGDEKTQ